MNKSFDAINLTIGWNGCGNNRKRLKKTNLIIKKERTETTTSNGQSFAIGCSLCGHFSLVFIHALTLILSHSHEIELFIWCINMVRVRIDSFEKKLGCSLFAWNIISVVIEFTNYMLIFSNIVCIQQNPD